MYAVVETGGKQYRVSVGDRLKVETLAGEPGDDITLEKVLLVADGARVEVGNPVVEGTSVSARVVGHGRGEKITVFKMRRRKQSMTRNGHRQNFTELEITAIGGATDGGKATSKAKEKPAAEVETTSAAPAPADGGEADDLTRINGIGPVIAGKLTGLGITRFEQIAAFTEEDVDRVNEQLNFKGRIEREDWIEQARKLVKEG